MTAGNDASTIDQRDVVRLYDVGSSGLVGMEIVKIIGGYTLQRLADQVDAMTRELGMESAKPAHTPEAKSKTKEVDDDELPNNAEHHVCRTVVDIAVRCSVPTHSMQ